MVQAVKSIESKCESIRALSPAKFVMVAMDTDIEEGIAFLKKYGSWDEVSVGSFYRNQPMMRHVNTLEVLGVPGALCKRTPTRTLGRERRRGRIRSG
ncbi:hypothetical protein CRI94_11825 [Longibacter salinarum]|uniref:Uncharacterized protein n=1 Tax=Longibacter salinarum TaxID=1850348 RepID=A0A2A8CVT0_9BACT|nr:hypothetical protein [Longibacter salinarum]PEN12710.1 hypothetical protein CRI94_11825 [Longibacter salinarum]